ncbi:MAG: hypothetical protein HKN25_15460 [Pyrinomonadaceae bacterium]|nr:hypothetical protein [Pyrinomonadaceae bacterium]
MIKVLQRMVFLLTILIVIKAPFFYFYKSEIDQLEEGFAAREFNSVFIGSSRTRSSIIPAYFDSLTKEDTQSYNYGTLGSFGHNNLNLAEEIIKNKSSIKLILFELSILSEERVGLTEELWDSFTFSRYWNLLKNMPANEIAGFHDRLATRFLAPHFSKEFRNFNVDLKTALSRRDISNPDRAPKEALDKTRSLNLRVEKEVHSLEDENDWKRILEIIRLAESKNIEIRFFVPPRLATDQELKVISALYRKLDNKNKLQANHAAAELYGPGLSIDALHLNRRGAMKFTASVATEFNKR